MMTNFLFFDIFNESETLKEPIVVEPKEDEILVSSYKKKKKRGGNFADLPVETIEYKLEDEEKVCDKEGISGFIKSADGPKALIAKSMVSPSLLAHLQCEKYVMATLFYRQEGKYARLGVNLSRQNLSNWDMAGAKILKPLYQLLKKNFYPMNFCMPMKPL